MSLASGAFVIIVYSVVCIVGICVLAILHKPFVMFMDWLTDLPDFARTVVVYTLLILLVLLIAVILHIRIG